MTESEKSYREFRSEALQRFALSAVSEKSLKKF